MFNEVLGVIIYLWDEDNCIVLFDFGVPMILDLKVNLFKIRSKFYFSFTLGIVVKPVELAKSLRQSQRQIQELGLGVMQGQGQEY